MQVPRLARSTIAQTAVVSLLTLAALALLGLVLAYWTWIWLAPRAEPRAEVVAADSGSLASASLVFGRAERHAAAPTGIAIRLLGVVAASGGRRGHAVVQLEAKQVLAVHEGEDVTPGVRLAEVHRDHVILERGGVRETLGFPEKKTTLSSAAPAGAPSAAPRAAEIAAPPAPEPVVPQAAQPAARRARGAAGRREDSDQNP